MKFDSEFKEMLGTQQELPRVVNEKWDAALLQIREGRVRPKRRRRPLRIAAKSCGALAASFAILLTVALVNPVFAESIPPLGEIIRFLKGDQSKMGAPAVVEQADIIEENLQAVQPAEKTTKLSVVEAYCDKDTLVATLCVEPDEALEQYDIIHPAATVKINGKEIQGFTCSLEKREDGSFVGIGTADVSDLDLSGEFSLEVSMDQAVVVDNSTLVLDVFDKDTGACPYSDEELQEMVNKMSVRERMGLGWTEQREEIDLPALSFTGTVTVDESLRRVYEVNEEQNGCTVSSVTVSPGSTLVDVTWPENVVYAITDNMGNEIGLSKTASAQGVYNPIYKGTTSLTFTFYNLNDRNTPAAVIEVPIEGGGYADVWMPAPRTEGDITYIPSVPETPADWLNREPEDQVFRLGETILLDRKEEGIKQEFTFSNMQVYDSPQAAGIDTSELSPMYQDGGPDVSGSKFITLDLNVKNLEGTANGVDMTGYGWPDPKYPGLMHHENVPGDYAYFSDAGQGMKDYGFAQIPDMTEYNGKVGFYWNEEDLKAGNLQLTLTIPDYESHSNMPLYLHIELPAYEE